MISILFKFAASIFASYVLLSFVYDGKYVFDHLNSITGPLGENIQKAINNSVKYSVNNSKKITKQLFTSSVPPVVKDAINTQQSAVVKKVESIKKQIKNERAPQEEISDEESRQLEELFHNEE